MATHDLKIWPEYYQAILKGYKTFEARKNDRGYAVGDTLDLREYDPVQKTYSGNMLRVQVSYIMDSPAFCAPGIVIMAIRTPVGMLPP